VLEEVIDMHHEFPQKYFWYIIAYLTNGARMQGWQGMAASEKIPAGNMLLCRY
jgi:hypothetical protein